jgi:hypothetical protein
MIQLDLLISIRFWWFPETFWPVWSFPAMFWVSVLTSADSAWFLASLMIFWLVYIVFGPVW